MTKGLNWQNAHYLREVARRMDQGLGRDQILAELEETAGIIVDNKAWGTLHAYYRDVDKIKRGKPSATDEAPLALIPVAAAFYGYICGHKGKILAGTYKQPLWLEPPSGRNHAKDAAIWHWYYTIVQVALVQLTGDNPQQLYDRVMVPQPDRWYWLPNDQRKLAELTRIFFSGIDKSLGNPTFLDYEELLASAMLNKRYELVEGRPILVQIDNYYIDKIVIMQKQNILIAKIVIKAEADFMATLDFDTGNIDCPLSLAFEGNYAIPTLIAGIYRDLVTIGEVTTAPRPARSLKPITAPEKRGNPGQNTIGWQYLPRSKCVHQSKSDVLADRERIGEAQEDLQRRIHRYHAVIGHVRRLADGQTPSPGKLEAAAELGIRLNGGETWIKPHARGQESIEAASEGLDITKIPHYLLRKRTAVDPNL